MAFYCIADADTVRGFRLAGVRGKAVSSSSEAGMAFSWAVAQPGCEVLILTEDVAAMLGPEMEAARLEYARPLLVEIPGPGGPKSSAGNLQRLARIAVGTPLEDEP